MALSQHLADLFDRDLKRLKKEIEAYPDEAVLWQTTKSVSNSAGNLSLHIVGNLQHFIGATLGNTGYVRHREAEFSSRDVPRNQILASIGQTQEMLRKVLPDLSQENLNEKYPLDLKPFPEGMSSAYFLVHLYGHLNYHLGQVNYHRRLLVES